MSRVKISPRSNGGKGCRSRGHLMHHERDGVDLAERRAGVGGTWTQHCLAGTLDLIPTVV